MARNSIRRQKKKMKEAPKTTWTDSKGTITQASKKGERVGEHVSHHRGKGGQGKPNWKQKLGNQLTRTFNRNRLKLKKKK